MNILGEFNLEFKVLLPSLLVLTALSRFPFPNIISVSKLSVVFNRKAPDIEKPNCRLMKGKKEAVIPGWQKVGLILVVII